ncbi:MAG: hypothetical protein ACLUQX_06615 [Thomasclavelia spiroformis]
MEKLGEQALSRKKRNESLVSENRKELKMYKLQLKRQKKQNSLKQIEIHGKGLVIL